MLVPTEKAAPGYSVEDVSGCNIRAQQRWQHAQGGWMTVSSLCSRGQSERRPDDRNGKMLGTSPRGARRPNAVGGACCEFRSWKERGEGRKKRDPETTSITSLQSVHASLRTCALGGWSLTASFSICWSNCFAVTSVVPGWLREVWVGLSGQTRGYSDSEHSARYCPLPNKSIPTRNDYWSHVSVGNGALWSIGSRSC